MSKHSPKMEHWHLLLRCYALLKQGDVVAAALPNWPVIEQTYQDIEQYFERQGWTIGYSDFKGWCLAPKEKEKQGE